MTKTVGRNEPCPCGSGAKFKRCCIDRAVSALPSHHSLGSASGDIQVVVDTPFGTMVRYVPAASPLQSDIDQGDAAEIATHDAAAVWGLPDFVYRAAKRQLGSGVRELGDGLVVVGDRGLVIQVKSRTDPTDMPEKELRWAAKQTRKAIRQANGTVRQLRLQPDVFTNRRGRELTIDGSALRWVACIVIDHPAMPAGFVPDIGEARVPTVVLLRRDWEFLFTQLKSTHAVGVYLARVADRPIELGHEAGRYHELALADANAEPDPLDAALAKLEAKAVSAPLLPLEPIPDDELHHRLVKTILEDVATGPMNGGSEADRLRILAMLDCTPGSQRASIGSFLLRELAHGVAVPAGETLWKMRSFRGGRERIHVAYAVCSTFSSVHHDMFRSWVELRHHDMRELTGFDLTTVAVLLTLRHDGVRPWDVTLFGVSGDVDFSDDELAAYRAVWRLPGHKSAGSAL
jgi:SEC-C motif